MKILIGLGNPGEKYKYNRHNVGQMFVDWLNQSDKEIKKELRLFKSDSFMNQSGGFVVQKLAYFKIKVDELGVAHDELDIRLGEYKIQLGVGPKVHYGINSIEAALGSEGFWRIRIGVDNRDLEKRTPGESYVLEDFNSEEKTVLNEVFLRIAAELAKPPAKV